jgi:Polyketide cyclase / dehydrase and lipid transport
VSERGWVSIENAIEIARLPEDAFDYLTDITKGLEWNPRTRRVEKLTPGEIGAGTRFDAEWIKGSPMVVEYVMFERPTAWASIARSRRLDVRGRRTDIGDGAWLPRRDQN